MDQHTIIRCIDSLHPYEADAGLINLSALKSNRACLRGRASNNPSDSRQPGGLLEMHDRGMRASRVGE
jgi:hypothetical protein